MNEEDFPEIERRMKKILRAGQRFYREELDAGAALERIDEMGEPYKREYAEELLAGDDLTGLSFYRNGPFLDMCEGPMWKPPGTSRGTHSNCATIAGAYWARRFRHVMMTRIYAWAFADKAQLDAQYRRLTKLALERDHKEDVGPRNVDIFHERRHGGLDCPCGWPRRHSPFGDELEKLAKEMVVSGRATAAVATPHLAKSRPLPASRDTCPTTRTT